MSYRRIAPLSNSFYEISELLKNVPCLHGDEDHVLTEHLLSLETNYLLPIRNSLLEAKREYSLMLPLRLGRGFWAAGDRLEDTYCTTKQAAALDIERLIKEPWLEFYILLRYADFTNAKVISFVHVPKCFGSKISRDISSSVGDSHLRHYNTIRLNPSWVRPWQRVNDARALLASLSEISILYISGHISLADMRISGLDHKSSFLFSTIRDPIEIIISHANYIVSCLQRHPSRPDSQNWSRLCKLEEIPIESMIDSCPDQLALKIIESSFFSRNYSNLLHKSFAPAKDASTQEVYDYIEICPKCHLYSIDTVPGLYGELGIKAATNDRFNESSRYIERRGFHSSVRSDVRLFLIGKDLPLWPVLSSLTKR